MLIPEKGKGLRSIIWKFLPQESRRREKQTQSKKIKERIKTRAEINEIENENAMEQNQ